ncbi:MAG TPA: hypothetical protein VK787_13355 [Puia sp.]|jgi:hypothetical protein|nr:hypothetical protein [Puia sp.]
MITQFKISITKQILEESKHCSSSINDVKLTGENCAIANALKYLFPDVYVTGYYIYPFATDEQHIYKHFRIELPQIAKDFIRVFDSLCKMPDTRTLLPEFEFEISLPDEIISEVNIDEIKNIVYKDLPALELNCMTN